VSAAATSASSAHVSLAPHVLQLHQGVHVQQLFLAHCALSECRAVVCCATALQGAIQAWLAGPVKSDDQYSAE
jgi:hypothetical protein